MTPRGGYGGSERTARSPNRGGTRARRARGPVAGRGGAGRSRHRYVASVAAIGACLGAILVQLFFVQGIDAARYEKVADAYYLRTVSYPAERGAILDRNGDALAMSISMATVVADPYYVDNPRSEAEILSPLLAQPEGALQRELSEPSAFVYLAHTVPDAVASKVKALIKSGLLPGVSTVPEPKRFYPAGQLAAPLLGFVGQNGQGLAGLEYKYNSLLEGKPGKLVMDADPAGYQVPGGFRDYKPPVRGDDIVLSIDEPLQYETEEALARAIVAAQAQSGIALVMSSRTGDLLAVAELTMPTRSEPQTLHERPALPLLFVPPSSGGGPQTLRRLASEQPVEATSATAFTTVYEPGSVEKLVTISGALASGAVKPTSTFSIPNSYDVAGTYIADAWQHPTLHWSVPNILAHSSDIGTVEIAQRMGMPTLLSYIHAFGIGKLSDIDFPGESAGLVPGPSQWSGTSIATIPVGQGLAVTAIQMLDAYNTIANGGVYVAPRLVEGYIDSHGKEHVFPSPRPHRVVPARVAEEMTDMLEDVVRVGTGQAANLSPYTVAGKTGTGLVPLPNGSGYYNNYFDSSFAGFVPAEDPAITAMVVVQGTHEYGAEASAPVFAMIARDALQELGIPPHRPVAQVAGVPAATPYGAEGEAAGPALPGLSGTPDVRVAPAQGPTTTAPRRRR
jgi:cell division protein FtsI (penicillin-binding protein 3)